MPRYRWNRDTLRLEEVTDEPRAAPDVPGIMRDLPAYKSPLGDGWIDGRAARREHLKRTNSREVDPSEWRGGYRSEKFANPRNLPLRRD
jgi:hypothetical protein